MRHLRSKRSCALTRSPMHLHAIAICALVSWYVRSVGRAIAAGTVHGMNEHRGGVCGLTGVKGSGDNEESPQTLIQY